VDVKLPDLCGREESYICVMLVLAVNENPFKKKFFRVKST
jgi:hypothetical protein